MATRPTWVPDRGDVIWIDCNPLVGSEMRDVRPMLVLSPREFNARTSLVIGLPMTTAPYNATNPFAVAVGLVGSAKIGRSSYVLCHQPKSFDWRLGRAKPHRLKKMSDLAFAECCERLNQIIGIA